MKRVYLFVTALRSAPRRTRTSRKAAASTKKRGWSKPIGWKTISVVMALFISAFVLGDKVGKMLQNYLLIFSLPAATSGVNAEPAPADPSSSGEDA